MSFGLAAAAAVAGLLFGTRENNTASLIENVQNNMLEDSSSSCLSNCSNIENATVTIISGSTFGGNVDYNQTCVASSSCVMENSLEQQLQNVLQASSQQQETATTSFVSAIQSTKLNNSVTIKQGLVNQLSQIVNATCSSTSTNIKENDVNVISDTNIAGTFNLDQSGNSMSNCAITNTSRQTVFNQVTATADQDQKTEDAFVTIIIAIVIAIIVGAILFFVAIKSMSGKKSGEDVQTEIAQLEALAGGDSGALAGGDLGIPGKMNIGNGDIGMAQIVKSSGIPSLSDIGMAQFV